MEQAHRKYGISRYFKKLLISLANTHLLSATYRAKLLKFAGVRVGNRVRIGGGITVDTMYPELLRISDDVTISTNVTIISHFMNPVGKFQRSYVKGPVEIGQQVFIGAGVIICKSVTIGEGAIIGAGSIVTKDIPAGEIWAGNPARFIKKRIS